MLLLLYICKQEWVVTMQKCSNYYYRLRCMFVWHRCFKLLTREKRTYVSVVSCWTAWRVWRLGRLIWGRLKCKTLTHECRYECHMEVAWKIVWEAIWKGGQGSTTQKGIEGLSMRLRIDWWCIYTVMMFRLKRLVIWRLCYILFYSGRLTGLGFWYLMKKLGTIGYYLKPTEMMLSGYGCQGSMCGEVRVYQIVVDWFSRAKCWGRSSIVLCDVLIVGILVTTLELYRKLLLIEAGSGSLSISSCKCIDEMKV